MGAARNGHAHAIKLLIAAGADVDAKGSEGYGHWRRLVPRALTSLHTDESKATDQAEKGTDNLNTGIDLVDKVLINVNKGTDQPEKGTQ